MDILGLFDFDLAGEIRGVFDSIIAWFLGLIGDLLGIDFECPEE